MLKIYYFNIILLKSSSELPGRGEVVQEGVRITEGRKCRR
jgi:hypothetical protein